LPSAIDVERFAEVPITALARAMSLKPTSVSCLRNQQYAKGDESISVRSTNEGLVMKSHSRIVKVQPRDHGNSYPVTFDDELRVMILVGFLYDYVTRPELR